VALDWRRLLPDLGALVNARAASQFDDKGLEVTRQLLHRGADPTFEAKLPTWYPATDTHKLYFCYAASAKNRPTVNHDDERRRPAWESETRDFVVEAQLTTVPVQLRAARSHRETGCLPRGSVETPVEERTSIITPNCVHDSFEHHRN